ncbi:MAG: O-antigen polysaccharide polymerase Wzy [Paludibacteraceae bacterium]|nr:O-antigen polysaccharide polymerase Wzy [Paludibacteraceae bacterium]
MIGLNKIYALIGVVVAILNFLLLYDDIKTLSSGWEFRCAITTFILISYIILAWKRMRLKFYSPVFFLLFSMYMFHLSSVSVIGMDTSRVYDSHQMLYRYGDNLGFYGFLYSELFIEIFIIGYFFFCKKSFVGFNESEVIDETDEKSLIVSRKIGLTLFSVVVAPELYYDILRILAKAAGGYSAMNGENDYTFYGIPLGYFTKLFMPSIIIILSSYRNNYKKFVKIAIFATLYFVILMFFTGRKGDTIQSLIPILFLYFYFFKPKFRLSYLIVIYFGLYFMIVVSNTRNYAMTSDFKENVINSIERASPIKDVCLEMGGTIKAPIQAIMAIPSSGDFQYGLSYPAAAIYSISCGVHFPLESIKKYALFNVYLSQTERGTLANETVAFMGGSIIAEFYWNFGWVGLPFALLLAWLALNYEKRLIENVRKPITFALYVAFLHFLLRWTRGYFADVVWQSLFIYMTIKLFVYCKYKSLKRNL